MGAIAAFLIRSKNFLKYPLAGARILFYLSSAYIAYFLYYDGISKLNDDYIFYGYTAIALMFASGILVAVCKQKNTVTYKILTNRFLTTCGKYCYAIYVFNRPFVNIIRDKVYNPNTASAILGTQMIPQIFFTFLLFTVSFILAFLSWHLLEKHFLKLKKFFPSVHSNKI